MFSCSIYRQTSSLGPIGEREDPNGFAGRDAAIEDIPQFRTLVSRIPDMVFRTEREHALLGSAQLLVATRSSERSIEAVRSQGLLQCVGLHHAGVGGGAVLDRVDALLEPCAIDVDDQIEPETLHGFIAKPDHVAEFPGGVDVQQRERQIRRMECLPCQMQHDRRVLADRIEHDRLAAFSDDFTEDEDRFRFQAAQVVGQMIHHRRRPLSGSAHSGRSSRARHTGSMPKLAIRSRGGPARLPVDFEVSRHGPGMKAPAIPLVRSGADWL